MKSKKPLKQSRTTKKKFSKAASARDTLQWKYYVALAIILLISFIAYLPSLNNHFLEWDDIYYIRDNPLIYSFDLKAIFSQNVMANYHPLTILTLATEYH